MESIGHVDRFVLRKGNRIRNRTVAVKHQSISPRSRRALFLSTETRYSVLQALGKTGQTGEGVSYRHRENPAISRFTNITSDLRV